MDAKDLLTSTPIQNKTTSDVTEVRPPNNLNEAEAAKQANLEALRQANVEKGNKRRNQAAEDAAVKHAQEHFDAATKREKQEELLAAHKADDSILESEEGPLLHIEQGTHKLTVIEQHGLNYNYLAHCSCAWQGRFMTLQLAEQQSKKHIFSKAA